MTELLSRSAKHNLSGKVEKVGIDDAAPSWQVPERLVAIFESTDMLVATRLFTL